MIKKIIFLTLLATSFLFATTNTSQAMKILTESDVLSVDNGILRVALKNKDLQTVSSVAISYFVTADNPLYEGNRENLQKKAEKLLSYCIHNRNVSAALFLVTKYLKSNPSYSKKIAKEVIEQGQNDEILRSNSDYYSIVMLFASSVLDDRYSNKEEYNYTIEAIMGLPYANAQANFFLAFLFKALNSYDLASVYLNDACHQSKPGSNIYRYCLSGDEVQQVDNIEDNVIKPGCKADIGQRCK